MSKQKTGSIHSPPHIAIRCLLNQVRIVAKWDISYHDASDRAQIDREPRPFWDHALWFAHCRLRGGKLVEETMELPLSTMLFEFRFAAKREFGYVPGRVMLYGDFCPEQIADTISTLLHVPREGMLCHLQKLLSDPTITGPEMLEGKVIVLGEEDYQSLATFSLRK